MEFYAKKFEELTTAELYEILKSRCEVFFIEQGICCQDMDDVDYDSKHFFLWQDGRVVAYLRAFFKNGDTECVNIGRVLSIRHNEGLGRELMQRSIEELKRNIDCKKILLNSQKQAVGFYEKFGFEVCSEEFLEEGVVHVKMQLNI